MRARGGRRGVDPSAKTSRRPSWLPDALGVAWTALATLVVLAPALRPGISLGPFSLLAHSGLTSHVGSTSHATTVVHNRMQSDQVLFFAPMTNLAWQQVHSGHLPLWNSYNVLGTPLAFNWESAVFSLPVLLSYLVHASFAYTIVVLAKLVIAGSGAYVCCRALGLRPISSALGGTAFELSGTMLHYSGWAITGVECWYGWIFGAAVLLIRGNHRARDTIVMAVSVAFAIYGGYPAALVFVVVALLLFCVVLIAFRPSGGRSRIVSLANVALAGAFGVALGAPLLLPGWQTANGSSRKVASGSSTTYPLSHITNLLASGLQGKNFKTAAYIGVIAVVFAVVAIRMTWKKPEVRALVVVVVVMGVLTFSGAVGRALQSLPDGTAVHWDQAVGILTLALTLLAAIGFDHLLHDPSNPRVAKWAFGTFAAAALALIGIATADKIKSSTGVHLGGLIWPTVQVVLGLVIFGSLAFARPGRRPTWTGALSNRRAIAVVLLSLETAFLITSGISFWSLSSDFFSPTPAVSQLQADVGTALVGLGSCAGFQSSKLSTGILGIRPDANIGYGVHELAAYDPILPESYYRSWQAESGISTPSSLTRLGIFCAGITTSYQAKVYGVPFILEPQGSKGPTGSVRYRELGGETLYYVPGTAQATLVPLSYYMLPLPVEYEGAPTRVVHHSDTSWSITVQAESPEILRLRLSAVPGWHATISGRPLHLSTWDKGVMLAARVPAGNYVVDVQYWPTFFSLGIHIALIAGIVMIVGVMIAWLWTKRAVALQKRNRPKLSFSPDAEGDHAARHP